MRPLWGGVRPHLVSLAVSAVQAEELVLRGSSAPLDLNQGPQIWGLGGPWCCRNVARNRAAVQAQHNTLIKERKNKNMARTITLLWDGPGTASVTVTGGSGYTFDGGAASFPATLSAASHSITAADGGTHLVAVTWKGLTIFSRSVLLQPGAGVVLNVSPSAADRLNHAAPATSTTAALAAVGNAINTSGKFAGKLVLNTTTGVVVVANGPLAADTWSTTAGVVTHTPV